MPADGDRALHVLRRPEGLGRRHRPEAMHAIFEAYGWRRMGALRHRGFVNHKQTPDARACLASAAQTPLRCHHRRDHDEPVFPDRSRDCEIDGPNQLWVADLTYIAILGGFVYLAAIMDAWSRRITGYAGRRDSASGAAPRPVAGCRPRPRGSPPLPRHHGYNERPSIAARLAPVSPASSCRPRP